MATWPYIECSRQQQVLGVTISEDLTWKKHIDNTVYKANKTLGFIRGNLGDCTAPVKAASYSTVVRPVLEYSSTVWDPPQTSDTHNLEQVQNRAARFVHRNDTERTPGCVINMVQNLGWESLQLRRYTNRLSMLFRIQHGLVEVTIFNPTTPVREVPNACGSYKQLKTSTSSHFTLILSVTGNDCIPLLPMSRLSRNLGKVYQVCLPSSCDPSRLSHLNKALTRDLGHFTCFIGHHSYTGYLHSEKITTLEEEEGLELWCPVLV